jgi:hypothetical protein
MFSKTTLALAVAIVLGTAFPSLAATKHHDRVAHPHSAIYKSPQQMSAMIELLPFHAPKLSAVGAGYLTNDTFAEKLER